MEPRRPPPLPRLASLIFAAVNVLLFAWVAHRPYVFKPDTQSYIDHAIYRTPGYPLFLDAMRLLGGAHALRLAQGVQILIGILCAVHLSATLRRTVRLPPVLLLLLHVLFLVPLLRCGEVLLTEALSCGLFLLLLSMLVRSIYAPAGHAVVGVAAVLLGLLLVRPQFMFLAPLCVPYLAWLLVQPGRRPLRNLAAVAALGAALSGSVLAQATHNYICNGRFVRIPFTGMQVLAVVLYFSGPADVDLFQDPVERRYFAAAMEKVSANRWRGVDRKPWQGLFEHFNEMYSRAYLEAIGPAFRQLIGREPRSELAPDDWIAFDRLALRVSLRLIARHPRQMVFHVLKQVQDTSGYMPLFMVLGIVLPLIYHRRTGAPAALLPVAAGAMGLTNYVLVALVEPLGARYLMYTESIQVPMLLIFCVHLATAPPPRGVGEAPVL